MGIIITNIYLFLMAAVLAILEIQIEGQHGWAKNLPTWRPHSSKWYVRLYSKAMSGKELTGYHASMFTFVALIFHLPYLFGLPLTIENWSKTLSLILLFFVFWDFLWFVLNPYYPLKQFKKEYQINHQKWFLGLPTDYWGGAAASLLVLVPAAYFFHLNYLYQWWLTNFGLFLIQTIFVILFTLYVLKIDNWHQKA